MNNIVTCRTCLQESVKVVHIFGDSLLFLQIVALTKIQVSPNDGLPSTICVKCKKKLQQCIEFIELCKNSDLQLRYPIIEKNDDVKEYDEGCLDNQLYSPDNKVEFTSNQFETLKTYDCSKEADSKLLRKLQCAICGKIMSSRFRLKTHLATHSQEKPFSCQYCDKKFSIQQNLKVHLRTHMGQKPHQCTICGKQFTQSSGLTVHKRKHSGLQPYKCNLCPRSFRTIGHLQYHIRSHTGDKSFECSTCGRSFITNGDLKSHMMTHTGEKPHICSVCGMRFSRASNLRRHLRNSHKQVQNDSCIQCKKKFLQKNDLEKHKCEHTKINNLN